MIPPARVAAQTWAGPRATSAERPSATPASSATHVRPLSVVSEHAAFVAGDPARVRVEEVDRGRVRRRRQRLRRPGEAAIGGAQNDRRRRLRPRRSQPCRPPSRAPRPRSPPQSQCRLAARVQATPHDAAVRRLEDAAHVADGVAHGRARERHAEQGVEDAARCFTQRVPSLVARISPFCPTAPRAWRSPRRSNVVQVALAVLGGARVTPAGASVARSGGPGRRPRRRIRPSHSRTQRRTARSSTSPSRRSPLST